MFFIEDGDRSPSPELLHFIHREFYAYSSNLDIDFRNVPTHTEDGIPIRKLYVSNLPPKTTRSELFGVFAQYGFIKSCWLKMGNIGNNNKPYSPTFAFVTYSDPADAYKALLAPLHEKTLRGRNLKISPADSWHQPVEDSNGVLHWKPRGRHQSDETPTPVTLNHNNTDEGGVANRESESDMDTTPDYDTAESEIHTAAEQDEGKSVNILDVLNMDCMTYILDYVPIRELILSERVSKGWQNMVHQYISRIRMFKTSWWPHEPVALTTAVLRRVLQRLGGSLSRLHIDHLWSVLNDRTAHTIGKFCPKLEELQIVGMHTKNWNPLVYGCKKLKRVSFISCSKLTDASLVQMVKSESSIESLTVANNTHVTGLFLTSSNNSKINSLTFCNCFKLQGSLLCSVANSLTNLTTLTLEFCPVAMWKVIPRILKKLPKLQELSLSEFLYDGIILHGDNNDAFCEAIATLNRLKKLNLAKNVKITNAVLQRVADSCPYLEYLDVSGCNSKIGTTQTGVGDEGVSAVCRGCTVLQRLDISYLAALTDAGLRQTGLLSCLTHLTARGNPTLTSHGLASCLASCHRLQELDVCGCEGVSLEETCATAVACLDTNPRPLILHLAGTSSKFNENWVPFHKLLRVNILDDLSHQHMRPDFVDSLYDEDSSIDSFDEILDDDDFFINDDHFYLDDDDDDDNDDDEYEVFLDLAFNAPGLKIV